MKVPIRREKTFPENLLSDSQLRSVASKDVNLARL